MNDYEKKAFQFMKLKFLQEKRMNKEFYFEIEEINNELKLMFYNLRHNKNHNYRKTYIQFDKRSLPELIKILEQGDCINLLKSFIVTTSWDQIVIDSLGDERSADGFCLELYNRRKMITNVNSDRFGPVTIPLGQKPEETGWEYIRPLIEDLKKYC